MRIIAICGLGGSGKEILDLVERINAQENRWDKIIFCDKSVKERIFKGYEVYTFEDIEENMNDYDVQFTISVGDSNVREKIYTQVMESQFHLASLIAPGVYVPQSTTLGCGVIIRDNSYISVDVVLEDNVLIQPNVLVGHDVHIGKNSIISPQSAIGGGVVVGKNTFIALGCAIKELVNIGDNTIVSMGTVVNKDVASGVIVRGNPVEVVSRNFLGSAFLLNRRNK